MPAAPSAGGRARPPRARTDAHPAGGRGPRAAASPRNMVLGAARTGGTVVLRTPPGGARLVASLIDATPDLDVLGCVAGNDVVVAVCRDGTAGDQVLRFFRTTAES
ncbi:MULTISPECIES: hypothetical protein [Streptomyces]|uniref:hypothetical protein n=1 Tax=Streptomyces TaxID=1883 RepID=UPI000B9EB4E6|nr:hypothetical protein [Streptomyces kasugaensis]